MLFECVSPHPLLGAFIKHYSLLEGGSFPLKLKPIPDGESIELGICYQSDAMVQYNNDDCPRKLQNFIGGVSHNLDCFQTDKPFKFISVSMAPYAIRYLFHQDPSDFKEHVDLILVLKSRGRILIEQLEETSCNCERIKVLDDFFLSYLRKAKPVDYKSKCLFTIESVKPKTYRTKELSDLINTTPRSLQRYFKDVVGVRPKELLELCRTNRIIGELRTNSIKDFSDIVIRYNYFDQSHFISEFKKATSLTPLQFLKKKEQLFLDYSRHVLLMPTEA